MKYKILSADDEDGKAPEALSAAINALSLHGWVLVGPVHRCPETENEYSILTATLKNSRKKVHNEP